MDVDCLVHWRGKLETRSNRMAAASKRTGVRAGHTRMPLLEYRGEARL